MILERFVRLKASPQRCDGIYLERVPLLDRFYLHSVATMTEPQEISTDVHKQLLVGLNIFHPSRLGTEDDIAVALDVLEGSLDGESIGPIVFCSLQPEHPYVFEFIVSCKLTLFFPYASSPLMLATAISKDSAELLSRFVLDALPLDADGFRASLGYKILSRISRSLSRLAYPSDELPKRLNDFRREIEIAPKVLEDLSKLLSEGFLDKGEAEGKTNKKDTRRGKTPRFKPISGVHAEISDRLFQALGREAPKSPDAADQLIQSVINTQKDILKVRPPPVIHHRLLQASAQRLVSPLSPSYELLRLQR